MFRDRGIKVKTYKNVAFEHMVSNRPDFDRLCKIRQEKMIILRNTSAVLNQIRN